MFCHTHLKLRVFLAASWTRVQCTLAVVELHSYVEVRVLLVGIKFCYHYGMALHPWQYIFVPLCGAYTSDPVF